MGRGRKQESLIGLIMQQACVDGFELFPATHSHR